jgi:hypothetical protein
MSLKRRTFHVRGPLLEVSHVIGTVLGEPPFHDPAEISAMAACRGSYREHRNSRHYDHPQICFPRGSFLMSIALCR